MNLKRATATLLAALILAGSPVLAAGTQSDPIRIDSVALAAAGGAAIAFTNEYDVPATEVVFALESQGAIVDRFDDVGPFATGVTISHTFGQHRAGPDIGVAIEKATFADGTIWVNPDVPSYAQPYTIVGAAPSDE